MKKTKSHELLANVSEGLEQSEVRLDFALGSRNPAGTLTRSVLTESVNAVHFVVQQLGYDAVSWF